MGEFAEVISQVLFVITIVIIGVEGIFSLLDRIGFLPPFLARLYMSRDKRLVTMTLQETHLYEKKPLIKQAIDYWRLETLVTDIDASMALRELVISTTRRLDLQVGLYKKVELQYYIDLAEYTTNWEKIETLVQIMCSSIRKSLASLDSPIQIDKIAAPPGNPALAVIAAAQLQRPFVSVTPISPLASDPISGAVVSGEHIVLMHDVVLTGYRLAAVANALRTAGARVEHAFVLVERTDSKRGGGETPSETLARNGIKLHSILSIDDDGLASLLKHNKQD